MIPESNEPVLMPEGDCKIKLLVKPKFGNTVAIELTIFHVQGFLFRTKRQLSGFLRDERDMSDSEIITYLENLPMVQL